MITQELLEILEAARDNGKLMVQGNGYEGIVKDLVICSFSIEDDTVIILVARYPG